MESDQAYFARRAAAEWFAVAATDCDKARTVHAELARRYAELANKSNVPIRLASATTPSSSRDYLAAAGKNTLVTGQMGI